MGGTTARLRAWLGKLTELINQRSAAPEIVTRTIMFFRPPTQTEGTPEAASNNLRDAGQQGHQGYSAQGAATGPIGGAEFQDSNPSGVTVESCAQGDEPLKQGAL